MNSENKSVFTTLGWDGKKKFFAVKEHLESLEKQAKIAGIAYDDDLKLKILYLRNMNIQMNSTNLQG